MSRKSARFGAVWISMLLIALCMSWQSLDSEAASSTPLCNVEQDSLWLSKFTVRDVSTPEVWWRDSNIKMSYGANWVEWHPISDAPGGANPDPHLYISESRGLFCNLTDDTGDGLVSEGDWFTIDYVGGVHPAYASPNELIIVYEPTGEAMWRGQFNNSRVPYEAWPSEEPDWLVYLVILCIVAATFVTGALLLKRTNSK